MANFPELANTGTICSEGKRLAWSESFSPRLSFGKVILEIKALSGLHDRHRAQVHDYLKATGLRLGILANFGAHLQLERETTIR